MSIQNFTSKLLISTILCQSIAPSIAMEAILPESPERVVAQGEKAPLDVRPSADYTAAGILHYALHNDEIKILLGRRIDNDGNQSSDDSSDDSEDSNFGRWCNFGGKSEDSDETLAATASRESGEESNGIFTTPPRILRHTPFIDLYTETEDDKKLYRMYCQLVNYVSPEIIKDKADSATVDHNKEFTAFKWIKACDLLDAVDKATIIL